MFTKTASYSMNNSNYILETKSDHEQSFLASRPSNLNKDLKESLIGNLNIGFIPDQNLSKK